MDEGMDSDAGKCPEEPEMCLGLSECVAAKFVEALFSPTV